MTGAIAGYAELFRAANAARILLGDPAHAQATLESMLAGKRVKAGDASTVAAALLKCAQDYQWQAKRYSHGRSTYAVGMTNDATRLLLALGVPLKPTDGSVWSRDGGFGWPTYAQDGPLHQPLPDDATGAWVNLTLDTPDVRGLQVRNELLEAAFAAWRQADAEHASEHTRRTLAQLRQVEGMLRELPLPDAQGGT